MKDFETHANYDNLMETHKWVKEIPFIKFPSNWQVKIIPPFLGATVRFIIKKGDAETSVYLDCYDNLGFVGVPYWEVYPYKDDICRCDMKNTNKLLYAIKKSLEQQS